TRTKYEENHEVNSFELNFSLCQVLVVRPWFYPELFANRGWILNKGEGWTFDGMPSDGASPPSGECVGYATQAIILKDAEIHSAEFVSAYQKLTSETGAGGSVGWGPVSL